MLQNLEQNTEAIAKSIIDISASMKAFSKSPLNRSAIVALIHDRSKVAKKTIELVLNNLEGLEKNYIKKPSQK